MLDTSRIYHYSSARLINAIKHEHSRNTLYILQAAIGALALDKAREVRGKIQEEILGKQILTLAVLSILITAPLGAALIAIIGPMLLHQTGVCVGQSNKICEDSTMDDEEGWVGCMLTIQYNNNALGQIKKYMCLEESDPTFYLWNLDFFSIFLEKI